MRRTANEYGVSYDKVCDDYGAVNCDLDKLVELLSKQRYTKWTKLHDYILAQGPENEVFYKELENTFSYNEIEERKRFLGEEGLKNLLQLRN